MMACCCADEQDMYQKPVRAVTDVCWLIIFIIFIVGMVFIASFAFVYGNPQRLIYGYDSFGNVCGFQNEHLTNVSYSGKDLTNQRYLFFLNLNDLRNSLKICVRQCPDLRLETFQDLQKFTYATKSQLCLYDLNISSSTIGEEIKWYCPNLPVYPSSPVLNRCVPQSVVNLPAKIIYSINGYLSGMDLLQQITSDLYSSSKELVILAAVACVLSAVLILVIHIFVKWIFCIVTTLVSLACIGFTAILWWTYVDLKHQLDSAPIAEMLEKIEKMERNERAFLAYSIMATIITATLLVAVLCMRREVPRIAHLFDESSNCMLEMPCLFFLPLWTMVVLFLYFIFWIAVSLCLATAFHPSKQPLAMNETYIFPTTELFIIEYLDPNWTRYMWWYYAFALIWVSEFILACQQIVMAGAIAKWYYSSDRENLSCPIWQSIINLIVYHIGSVAKGALLITVCKLPRIILTFIQTKLKQQQQQQKNACSNNCFTKCCSTSCCCCLWCFEKFLKYINHNAYTVIAVDGCNFCLAAEEAFECIKSNSVLVATLNSVGDFVLFLGKVLVTTLTGIIGLLVMKNNPNLHFYAVPIVIACLLAYFIAHCILSLFEMIVDVLTLCYCENEDLAPDNLRALFRKTTETSTNEIEMMDLSDNSIY